MKPLFNYKKASQALNFLAQKNAGQINRMKAVKLVYFADRYHLRKYGRLITDDTYLAMTRGPVASGVKDIAESSFMLDEHERDYASAYIKPSGNYSIKSVADVDHSVLSESNVEALNFAWDTFGALGKWKLRDITRKYPEWKKHEELLKGTSSIPMDIKDFLADPIDDVNKCHELSEKDKLTRLEQLND